jgi:hypothetical protein
MRKIHLLLFGITMIFCLLSAQEVITGIGEDFLFEKADQKAIMDLCSQISVQVNVQFTEKTKADNRSEEQISEQLIQTYSTVILENVSREVCQAEDGKWIVKRILNKEDRAKLFNHRKQKIFQYIHFAEQAVSANDYGNALKHYYWALLLLKSHPDKNNIRYNDDQSRDVLLPYLNSKIQNLLHSIQINVYNKKVERDLTTFYFNAGTGSNPLSNLKISYFDGIQPVETQLKDGKGIIYLPNSLANDENLTIQIDYEYNDFLKDIPQDEEVKLVKESLQRIPFDNRKRIALNQISSPQVGSQNNLIITRNQNASQQSAQVNGNKDMSLQQMAETPVDLVQAVVNYISSGQKTKIEDMFTSQGYTQFKKVLSYGKVKIHPGAQEINTYQMGSQQMVRSIPLEIELKDKNRKILKEDISLILENNKVAWVNFTTNDQYINESLAKGAKLGDQAERLKSIQFLEYYKTMFALKETDRIADIFADSALIFIGYVKAKAPVDKRLSDVINKELKKEEIAVQKLSKDEYIDRIRKIFNSNTAINLNFSDVQIAKRSRDKAIYMVQLKQDYYSSNYSDKGYLVLFYDLTDTDNPQIFFRYWQPSKMQPEELEQVNRMSGRFRF